MDKTKKVYVDSIYKTNDSISNRNFKFELKESIDLPDNTVCYIDDICIPHTWYTLEHYKNKLYIENACPDFSLSSSVLTIPEGSYNAATLASTLQSVLQSSFPNEHYNCVYSIARGSITISADRAFWISIDEQAIDVSIF